jgi:hypothetical protein
VIALGIVTFRRPDYFAQTLRAVEEHLASVVDEVQVATDVYPVATAKNRLLSDMLDAGADWLFLLEDDITPLSPMAVTGYIEACERSGWEHLCFHAHGPANPEPNGVDPSGAVTYWPNSVGAYCVYSRRALEVGGLMDEDFHNAFEHVEHYLRLADHGFCPNWPHNADATGSENWLAEIPGSIDNSSIVARDDWQPNMQAALAHFEAAHPSRYQRIWG